jgi:cell division protein FtsW (lipid II flippase)
VSAFETDSPQRLAKHFIALSAMKLMQEILEIARRWLFVPLQSKQPCDFVIVKLVHFFSAD